jgi:hypothetical protein
MMEPSEAARRVLSEAPGESLHWTVVWDRALKSGYVDPFTQPEARETLVRWLAEAARSGVVEKVSTGTYRWRRPVAGGG